MASRYDKAGIFFYNENDGQIGVLPLTSGMTGSDTGAPPAPQQPVQQPPVTQTPVTQDHAHSPADITVLLNGQALSFDQPPTIVNDRTLVPLRAIFQALGAQVNWDSATQTISILHLH